MKMISVNFPRLTYPSSTIIYLLQKSQTNVLGSRLGAWLIELHCTQARDWLKRGVIGKARSREIESSLKPVNGIEAAQYKHKDRAAIGRWK